MVERRVIVLVVDDNATNLDLLSRRLVRSGYEVRTADSGAGGLAIVEREPIDIVLLDVMMPGMSGLEVLAELRRKRGPHELPVIMATAKSEGADVVGALDLGANDYVTKPIDLEVLLARMRAQLRRLEAAVPDTDRSDVPAVGAILDGKYRLDAVLGSGGFGTVYRARHMLLLKDVALKVLHEHLLQSDVAMRRFGMEGVSACRVRHPNAVAVLDAGSTSRGVPYLVLELLEGVCLQEELAHRGLLELRRVAAIIRPICDVLAEAHRSGIVHRDVKPANVMLARTPDGEVVKVLDFGIAKLVESSADPAQTLGDFAGTPDYMAPERLLGRASDHRADVYSVGVMAYEMLCGELPFGRTGANPFHKAIQRVQSAPVPLLARRGDLPEEVEQIVMNAIAFRPDVRPELHEIKNVLVECASRWSEKVWPPAVSLDVEPILRDQPSFVSAAPEQSTAKPAARNVSVTAATMQAPVADQASGIGGGTMDLARILVVRCDDGGSHDELGALESVLGRRRLRHDWLGEADEPTRPISDYSHVVALGTDLGAHGRELPAERRRLLEDAIARGIMVLGISGGARRLAEVLGGRAYACPHGPEMGWFELAVTEHASNDALWSDAPSRSHVLELHTHTFDLPRDAVLLAHSAQYASQVFRWGTTVWGLSFHADADDAFVEAVLRDHGFDDVAESIRHDAQRYMASYRALCDSLLDSFFARASARTSAGVAADG